MNDDQSPKSQQAPQDLPALLTQTVVQNICRLSGPGTLVNSGLWGRDKRPEIVVFIDVQSISRVKQQLQVDVAGIWRGRMAR